MIRAMMVCSMVKVGAFCAHWHYLALLPFTEGQDLGFFLAKLQCHVNPIFLMNVSECIAIEKI